MKDISKNKLFIFGVIFFLIWIFLHNFLLNIYLSFIIAILLLFYLINFWVYTKKFSFYLIIIFISFAFWIFYSNFYNEKILEKEHFLEQFYDNKKHKIIFEVDDVYKKLDFSVNYTGKIKKIAEKKVPENLRVLVKIPRNYDISLWEKIEVFEKIVEIENFSSSFDYKNFLKTKDIFLVLNPVNFQFLWEKEEEKNKNIFIKNIEKFNKNLQNFRQKFIEIIHKIYPEKEAIFLAWILIWAREEIPKDLKTNFNNSWLTHLIAVSGFNITIIVIFLSFLFKIFPASLRVFLVTSFIIVFTMIVGANPAVVRASIMWVVAYFIISSGRKGDALAILLFTAFLMTLYNPLVLNFDISFHLSFLAVLGLLYTQKFWEKVFYFLPTSFAIRESFVLTLSAFSFTIPIVMFNFGQISVLSPIANMLVWGVIPFAMLFWFLAVLLYFLNPVWGVFFWVIDYIFLKYVIVIVTFFWEFKYSIFKTDFWENSRFFEIIYFIVLVFLILYFRRNIKNRTESSIEKVFNKVAK